MKKRRGKERAGERGVRTEGREMGRGEREKERERGIQRVGVREVI